MKQLEKLESITNIDQGIVRILGQNPGHFTLQGTNTYLLGSGQSRALVDTGAGEASYLKVLKKALEQNNVLYISDILITHKHKDHVGGIEDIAKMSCRRSGMLPQVWMGERPADLDEDLKVQQLADGAVVVLEDGFEIHAVATPGHTADHFAFWLPACSSIISGDTILGQEYSPVFENLQLFLKSLQSLLWFMQRHFAKRILPGHGPVIENGPEQLQKLIGHRQKRHEQVYEILKRQQSQLISSKEIAEELYQGYDSAVMQAAEHLTVQHLKLLRDDGLVEMAEKDGGHYTWRVVPARSKL